MLFTLARDRHEFAATVVFPESGAENAPHRLARAWEDCFRGGDNSPGRRQPHIVLFHVRAKCLQAGNICRHGLRPDVSELFADPGPHRRRLRESVDGSAADEKCYKLGLPLCLARHLTDGRAPQKQRGFAERGAGPVIQTVTTGAPPVVAFYGEEEPGGGAAATARCRSHQPFGEARIGEALAIPIDLLAREFGEAGVVFPRTNVATHRSRHAVFLAVVRHLKGDVEEFAEFRPLMFAELFRSPPLAPF